MNQAVEKPWYQKILTTFYQAISGVNTIVDYYLIERSTYSKEWSTAASVVSVLLYFILIILFKMKKITWVGAEEKLQTTRSFVTNLTVFLFVLLSIFWFPSLTAKEKFDPSPKQIIKCDEEKGYIKAVATGKAKNKIDALINARRHVHLQIIKSQDLKIKAKSEHVITEFDDDVKNSVRNEITTFITSSSEGVIADYTDENYEFYTEKNKSGQTIYVCSLCGKVPVERKLKALENTLANNPSIGPALAKKIIESIE